MRWFRVITATTQSGRFGSMRQRATEDVIENKPPNGNGTRRQGKSNSVRAKKYRSALQVSNRRVLKNLKTITGPGGLDGRSHASKQFTAIIQAVCSDLGGADNLTEIERHLITSFAGAAILQGHQVAKLLNGGPIDIHEYSSLTTAMIRSATRLGTERRTKEVPSLDQYLQMQAQADDLDAEAAE
jgi:hypothetical protein